MVEIDIGDKSPDAPDFLPLYIAPGGTTVVLNVAGDIVNYFLSFDHGTADGTIANSASQSFTTGPIWIQSPTRTTVQITGPGY